MYHVEERIDKIKRFNELVEHQIREQEWRERTAIFSSPSTNLPSNYFVDSPLIGNGDIGITIGGNAEEQTFYIGKNDFWAQPHIGETEEQTRERLLDIDGRRTGAHVKTVGQLTLRIPQLTGADFRQEQDILHAEVRGTFAGAGLAVRMCSWVSATTNLFVTEVECESEEEAVDLKAVLHAGAKGEYEVYNYKNGADEDLIWFNYAANSANVPETRRVAVVSRIVGADHAYDWCFENVETSGSIAPGSRIFIITAVVSNLDDTRFSQMAEQLVRKYGVEELRDLKQEHRSWWRDYWKSSYIQIDDPLLEKFYYASYYVIGSCSRAGKVPPGIIGSWVTNDRPMYSGGYTLNYNYEAPYWGLYSGNRINTAASYCDPLLDLISLGQWFAKEKLNCRGIYMPVQVGPWGMPSTTYFHGQKSNAVYGAVNMLMHFYHTYDLDYAKEVYPYLLQTANFWEDYLVFEEGRYVIYDDSVHELSNDRKNPILSLGLVRMLMEGLLEISKELGIDEDRRNKWNHILLHISPYPIFKRNDRWVFRLTEEGMEWNQVGALAVQHVYPAGMIGLDSPPALLAIARNTVDEMQRWRDNNAFTTFYPAAVRVGYDPLVILQHLRKACEERSQPNLAIHHGGGGIEDSSAVPNTLHEMLLQSYEGILRFFPVWPTDKPARFGRLRTVGAFLVSSEYSDGQVQYVVIESERGRNCEVLNPWPYHSVLLYRDGRVEETLKGTRLLFATKVNERIILIPEGL